MTNGIVKKLLVSTLMVLLIAGISGCGRKGGLEAPPNAKLSDDATAAEKEAAKTKPDNPFILDGLI